MKVLGREPAAWLGLIGALATVAVTTQVSWFSAGQEAAGLALLTGLVMAFTVRPVQPALLAGVVSLAAAVLTAYGLNLSPELVGTTTGAVLAACAFFGVRPQVSPVETPVNHA